MQSIDRYSRNHCFTAIPNEAEERLRMRLANQHTLTRISETAALNVGRREGSNVELRYPFVNR